MNLKIMWCFVARIRIDKEIKFIKLYCVEHCKGTSLLTKKFQCPAKNTIFGATNIN